MVWPDPEITCVDCLGRAVPLGWTPEDGELEPGTVLPYRCIDCWDRWDLVVGSGEEGRADD